MTIHYTTNPKTFEELVDAIRGQLERTREEAMHGRTIPYEERVVITTESFLALTERVEQFQFLLSAQAEINHSVQQLFLFVFQQLGIDLDEVASLLEEMGDEYEE